MEDKIKINTGRLGADADSIQRYIENISNEISRMKESVRDLEKMWEGPGSRAFQQAFLDDISAVETVIKNLKSIYSYDTRAKQEYEKCERNVSFMIAAIKV